MPAKALLPLLEVFHSSVVGSSPADPASAHLVSLFSNIRRLDPDQEWTGSAVCNPAIGSSNPLTVAFDFE